MIAGWGRRATPALLAALVGLAVPGAAGEDTRRVPVPVIFDTDIGPDVDDAGAAGVLNALADLGEASLLAMGCCTSSEWGAPCLDAINTYYGRPDIPIGTNPAAGFLVDSAYNERIARRFPNDLRSGRSAPDAVDVYRRALAKSRDGSVRFVAVGPLPNLARLLGSRPDRHSRLDGVALVARKVRELHVMGGRYPNGKEWNFEQDPAASARVMAEWPTPVVASGFEIGARVMTGRQLHRNCPHDHPVRGAYALFPGVDKDRESWDLTSVLAAVRGPRTMWELREVPGIAVDGRDGTSRVVETRSAFPRAYLVEREAPERVAAVLEQLMTRPAAARRPLF